MTEWPPETCLTLIVSSSSGMPRAETSSAMASFGIAPEPSWPTRPSQNLLHGVSNNFACDTTGPPSGWSVEAATFPPRRIPTSGMHCCLEAAGQRLPKLIASHQQTLAMGGTCLVEFGLLLIRLVIVEAVLGPSS